MAFQSECEEYAFFLIKIAKKAYTYQTQGGIISYQCTWLWSPLSQPPAHFCLTSYLGQLKLQNPF